jgi:hypothetical protein
MARSQGISATYDKRYDIGGKGLNQHSALFGDEDEVKALRKAGANEFQGRPVRRKRRCAIQ